MCNKHTNSTGIQNSFFGSRAGFFNTTGNGNSFVGHSAGEKNTTGADNSFVGLAAGFNNTIGKFNSFIGSRAGQNNTSGSENSFIGASTGFFNNTGANNTFLGHAAGYSNTSGSQNSFLGSRSGQSNSTGYYNNFVGYAAGFLNSTGNSNSFVGHAAGYSNTTGSGNTFEGFQAGSTNTIGSDLTLIGRLANPSVNNLVNATAIGSRTRVSASNALILGSINGQNGATANTRVGIGTTAPGYRLHVNASDAAKVGGGSWIVASDKRLKKDIKAFSEGLEVLQQIKPVRFRYNGKAGIDSEKEFVGIIAQEVQQVAPYMIGKFTYQDSTGKQEEYLDYDASALTYILVNSVKELKQENAALQAELSSIKNELAMIKQMLLKQTGEPGSVARIWQNAPNPYSQSTTIRYQVPTSAMSASIKVFSLTGQELHSIDLSGKTAGEVILETGKLEAGTYVYTLLVDGQAVDSKKLVLQK